METDVNTDEIQEEPVETESSPAKHYEPIEEDGFVSTLEFKEVEPEDAGDGGDTPEKQEKPDSEDKDSKGPVPYERFQEVINQRNEDRKAREELEQRLAKLETKETKQEKPKSKYNYHNIMAMSDEDIMQELTDTPKQFLQKAFQDFAHEFYNDLQTEQQAREQQYQQQTTQEKAISEYQAFFKDREDGIAMLQDGSIDRLMKEKPWHNPVSAYWELAGDQNTKAQIEAAVKKERDKLLKQLKAAGKAGPVRSETASKTYADPSPKPAANKADLKQGMFKFLTSNQ